jgi:hypothetical protein
MFGLLRFSINTELGFRLSIGLFFRVLTLDLLEHELLLLHELLIAKHPCQALILLKGLDLKDLNRVLPHKEPVDVSVLSRLVLCNGRHSLIEQESWQALGRYAEVHNFTPIEEDLLARVVEELPGGGLYVLKLTGLADEYEIVSAHKAHE